MTGSTAGQPGDTGPAALPGQHRPGRRETIGPEEDLTTVSTSPSPSGAAAGPGEPPGRSQRRAERRHPVRRALVVLAVLVLVAAGFVGFQLWSFNRNLVRSSALEGVDPPAGASVPAQAARDLNILVMGLDSRLDVHGNPLPDDIAQAITDGATGDLLGSDVLIVLHLPADGSKASAVSIPRDDQVALAGCPMRQCDGKIRQGYALGFEAERQRLTAQGGLSTQQIHDLAREAARRTQISTVQQFLGIGIDHFVEVTMAAFYEVARVVQPITVCLKRDTKDSHSGADFKAGEQQISAEQALAFVRQRQDPAHPDMTDLDRSRRQQAFIVSLLSQLRQAQTLSNPARLKDLLEVGTRNTVVDSRLDLLSFVGQARDMAGGNLTLYTLPIEGFGKSRSGEDVNIVDAAKIRATVAALFAPAGSPTTGAPTPSATASAPSRPTGAGASTSPTSPRSTTRPGPTSPAVPTPIDATGGGKTGPAVTELSELTSGGIPCVR